MNRIAYLLILCYATEASAEDQQPSWSFTLGEKAPVFHPPVGNVPAEEPSLADQRPPIEVVDPIRQDYLKSRSAELKRRREAARQYHLANRPYRGQSYARAQGNYAAAVTPYAAQGYSLHQLAVARYSVCMTPPSCSASRRRY